MGIEDYNFLKSTLEEVSILQEDRKKIRKDLKGWKKSLTDLEQELAMLRDNLESVTSREGNMPSGNKSETKLAESRELEKDAVYEENHLLRRLSSAEKRAKEGVTIHNETFLLLSFQSPARST